jgi:hypothetical protein
LLTFNHNADRSKLSNHDRVRLVPRVAALQRRIAKKRGRTAA